MSATGKDRDRFATVLCDDKSNQINEIVFLRGEVSPICGVSGSRFANFLVGNGQDFDRIRVLSDALHRLGVVGAR